METIKVTYQNLHIFWNVAEGNPIKSIRFEHTQSEEYLGFSAKFNVKYVVFKDNPNITYIKTDDENLEDDRFEEPVKDIENIIPQYLHGSIHYFYQPYGIYIILKGDISSFPMDAILKKFKVEFLDSDKLALSHNNLHSASEKCFNFLRKYKNKV